MQNDANLVNLEAGGVLDRGFYQSITSGAASIVDLRSSAASSIVQIGTNHAGLDTTVTLSGANSVLEALPLSGGTATTIDQSLTTIAQSGQLQIGGGRVFAASNAVTNAGVLSLSGGTFTQPGALASSGLVTGNGTVGVAITNTGSVVADGGTLNSQAISGLTGLVRSNAGATLNLAGAGGPSQAGTLVNNGSLALGGNDILVQSDYQNAAFGSGNAFNAHANVTGSGLILAASATQDLSGAGLNLADSTLNVGNVRLGGTSSTTLTITNNGTLTTLRGAVESPVTNTVAISSSNFVVGPNGGSTDVTLSYTGTQAGSLSGNTITVANNFDNVADRTLTITGAAYNPAAASLTPNPINLGATRVGGTLSGLVTIANTAPSGQYSESLAVTSATGASGATGTRPTALIAAGGSATSTVSLNTGASGTLSGTVTYGLATDGTGTSGLAQAALPSQVETVTGKVYQLAVAQLGTNSVAFATVRQGSAAPTASVSVTNGANGALNDSLSTSIGSLPTGVTGTAPASLAGGQQGALSFAENTATAGNYTGTAQINFQSTDPDLAPADLPSQNVNFSGTVTQIAVAQVLKDFGVGTLTGSVTDYALDLGSFSGSGSTSTDLGVTNAIPNFAYDETLGGTFGSTGGTGYTFNGQTFTGLTGGGTDMGNALSFTYSGLADGTYTDVLTFNGYSRYTGLTDLQLSPIRVTVTARVTGGVITPPTGAVPEPASWTMMLVGFGSLGVMMRRRKAAALRAA
ncbi:choice-of-anchor D domain-containing protein [uncultured Sphingomonas sp.]|uniref:choice-of-anchor D domain-containing protein n=1 Tax=uncultured Sphingomonas sp. TaxID=158754 RepID=UPI0035CA87E1